MNDTSILPLLPTTKPVAAAWNARYRGDENRNFVVVKYADGTGQAFLEEELGFWPMYKDGLKFEDEPSAHVDENFYHVTWLA
jgi:hypothetical protein